MIKRFCDICDSDLTHRQNFVHERFKESPVLNGKAINIEITLGVGQAGQWNQGDLCHNCLSRALAIFFEIIDPPKGASK
jgi:hypothetical protein